MEPGPGPDTLAGARLMQINRLTTIARFVSGLAHEINNSLQVMGGMVELLADRTDLPADVAMRLHKIGGQADRASVAVRQVLAFVRDIGGGPSVVDVGTLVDDAIALRRYQLGRNGVAISWERAGDDTYRVLGDARALRQLVLNLVVNAEEALVACPQSQRQLSVRLAKGGGRVQLIVEDTGAGVPAELRERIFEPFFSTKESERAVGLGLTVGAEIAAAHDGRLLLTDAAPGATFLLDLPESREK
jgi:signal transduction histidine kinase